ncbi:hypothetical protein ACO0K9_14810 [Undibacterium sp. Ji50W]|uniref:hypothetical protein n=1 Tax=Undibacterium sp. Ji50W TaxID=3413041 RepID=UPI003BF26BF6
MKTVNSIVSTALTVFLTGCASALNPFTTDKTFAGISPPQIHRQDDDGRLKNKMGISTETINSAEARPFVEYYEALTKAANAQANETSIDDYVAKGITVVNISCLRWFTSLSESQSRFAYTQNNQNVIQNLGTTLLGIGKANSIIVGTFGALFTGLNGVENNFSQSFLLAPNASKVKDHIFTALDQQAERLLMRKKENEKTISTADTTSSLRPKTFTEAYMALERYADICTQQTAKAIVNASLDQTQTKILSDQGNKVSTVSTQTSMDKAASQLSQDAISFQKNIVNTLNQLQSTVEIVQKDNIKNANQLQNAIDAATANNDKKIDSRLNQLEQKLLVK